MINDDDDDAVLAEGRSLVMEEYWIDMTQKMKGKQRKELLDKYEAHRMKFKFKMKPDAFVQLVKVMNFIKMDVIVMRSMGIIRDPHGEVNIYLSDEHMKNMSMKKLIRESKTIERLSKHSIFLTMGATQAGLVIQYKAGMATKDIKKQARLFWDIPDDQMISLQRLTGETLRGITMRSCKIKPGDCIQVVD